MFYTEDGGSRHLETLIGTCQSIWHYTAKDSNLNELSIVPLTAPPPPMWRNP
jgi:hypothetical protein